MHVENEEIIEKLNENFDLIQSKLENKPILGASKWHLINFKILNDKGLIEINMEDGHIQNNAILEYSKKSETFEIIKEFKV